MRRLGFSFLFLFLLQVTASGQAYTISTFAGPALPTSGTVATAQAIDNPYATISDGSGGYFVASIGPSRIYQVSPAGVLTVFAGSGIPGFSGDGGPATAAQINSPTGMARDASGNLFFADSLNNRIRKISPQGTITTIAGTGVAAFAGDGGPAVAAQIRAPHSVAVDAGGNIYIADFQNILLRKITPDGNITTIAGTGAVGFTGDGGRATDAQINAPESIAVDGGGNIYFVETNGHRIRKVTQGGIISTVVGTGTAGFSGDGGPAVAAQLSSPFGATVDEAGNLYIADTNNSRIRRVTPAGIISTVVGSGVRGFLGDGGAATSAQMNSPYRVAIDEAGNMLISDLNNNRVRRVTPAGIISTVGGNGTVGFSGDNGPANAAQLNAPYSARIDPAGNVLIAEFASNRIRRVAPDGTISTLAGTGVAGFSGDNGPAGAAQVRQPTDIAIDGNGNIYFADSTNYRIRRITPAGVVSTVAGRGTAGFSGDTGPATNAQFNPPVGLALDTSGTLYVSDQANHRVRRITASGTIVTFAGTGTAGSSGDGGAATGAQLNSPSGVAVDSAGGVFIADTTNHRIRKVTAAGVITTVVGTGVAGFSGDGGPAIAAQLSGPQGIAVDAAGNLYIADTNNNRLRRVTPGGVISTIAGSTGGFRGDGGPAAAAWLLQPRKVALDDAGQIYVADAGNQRIRLLTPARQATSTFTVADRGGMSLQSLGTAGGNVSVGYARLDLDQGSAPPAGFAVFGLRQNSVLVSEAAVPASTLVRAARVYAEVDTIVNTGVAIANPNDQNAVVTFNFTDANGDFGQGSTVIPANGQIAKFLNQPPFNGRSLMSGTFSFTSSLPVAVVALRGLVNERSEFLLTTLPVTEITGTPSTSPVLFPHFADGGGWQTQIVLVNPTSSTISGSVQFRDRNGQTVSFGSTYSIAPRASQKVTTPGASTAVTTGSVRIVPSGTTAVPSGLAIFSFRNRGVTVSEAGVPAQAAGNSFLVYAESVGDFPQGAAGSMRTGLAIANTTANPTTVVVEVQNLDGSTGLIGVLPVPGNGQAALFMNEIPGLETLITPFSGVLRLSSAAPVTLVGLRGRYNERNDLLITTTPPSNESAPPPATSLFFPHLADAGGYFTQFNLFSSRTGQPASGTLRFFSQAGGPLLLVIR